jgi:hypothetical protein
MPRTDRIYQGRDTAWFDHAVVDAYQGTTREERKALALAWMTGNFDFYKEFSESRKLLPAAVIVASLDEYDHPLTVEARSPLMAAARVLLAEVRSGYRMSTGDVDIQALVHSPVLEPAEVL